MGIETSMPFSQGAIKDLCGHKKISMKGVQFGGCYTVINHFSSLHALFLLNIS
jgi:hypothetical protein